MVVGVSELNLYLRQSTEALGEFSNLDLYSQEPSVAFRGGGRDEETWVPSLVNWE